MMKKISQKLAKKIFLSLLIIGTSLFSMASTYYISNTGNDANSGLSTSLPWKTLAKVNAATFRAGDQILFQKGSTFYGTITVKNSGVAGSPITYGAYGTGDNPVITGFKAVTSWTNLGSNIWESTSAVSSLTTCNIVTINGINTPKGRTPNSGSYYTLQSHNANVSITSSNLTGTPNWTGAKIVNRIENWAWRVGSITSQSGSTINYTDGDYTQPKNGNGFFIQDDARTLDQQNEWYFNPATDKLRIYSTTQPTNINVPSYEYGFDGWGRSYISIENLIITGYNTNGINLNTFNNVRVSNCTINKIGLSGINCYDTDYVTVNDNKIKNCNFTAISSSANSNYETITNNTIDSTNMIIGVPLSSEAGAIMSSSDNSLIQFNNIDHSGYNGIFAWSQHGQVRNNFINNSLLIAADGGAIYTSHSHVSLVIDGNICLNSFGFTDATAISWKGARGIYLDFNSNNVIITNNTVAYNSVDGYFANEGCTHNTFTNNVAFDNFRSQFAIQNSSSGGSNVLNNNTLTNNIFISKLSTQFVFRAFSTIDDITTFISTASGNYYARPIDDNLTFYLGQPNVYSGGSKKTLAQWKTFSGKDADSKKSPQAITSVNDLQFEYNATKTAKTITLSQPMMDVKGTKYASSVTLQPYTSVVLMKDYNASKTSTEYKSICDGLSYNGWTTTGKYVRTLVAKSGIDSIVTTYLTVNPKYAIQENVTINSGETYQGWNSSGTYSRTLNSISGCDSIVTTYLTVSAIKVGETMTQTIALKKGNNMISTYLQAANPDVSVVTKTIRDSGYLIKVQNESGSSYENWGTLGGWTNNLGSMQNTEGYKITVANDCVLQVTGTQIGLPLNISLNVGWNIISFPRTDILDAKMIVQSLIDQSALVKVQDEIGNSIEDWGVFGGWKNGIGNFLPGKAYRVKVSKIAVLTIQDIYPKSVAIPVYAQQTQHFNSIVEGNGSDHMNINLVGLSESGLSSGDELAAFDGTICVGTLKITDQHMMEGTASLIASCSTGNLQKDGFNEGASIQLQKWNQISGEASGIQLSILRGSSTYLKNATMLGKLNSLTTSVSNFAEETKIEVYPNPSQGRFTVRYSELPASGSRIDVLDISGRKIASRLITGISEEFDLFGQAAGLYLVKSILGVKENIDKLIIQY